MNPARVLAAANAPTHPSFRWTPVWDPQNRAQHRRNADGSGTACGIVATLTLAEGTDKRCERGCWA